MHENFNFLAISYTYVGDECLNVTVISIVGV